MNSKNLEDLIIVLIKDHLNEESSKIIKEIINYRKTNINEATITKSLLIKNIKNINQKDIENIIEKLINLNFIEFNEQKKEEFTLNINNILNTVLYPRYCYYVTNKYGPKYLDMFEYLLKFGFYSENLNTFSKNDFVPLIRDGLIVKTKIEKKENSDLFSSNNINTYKINFQLLNDILFREYIIKYYRNYISTNLSFYELFKKVINSNNFIYQLKAYEKNLNISELDISSLKYKDLLIKDHKNDKLILNKEMIKYELFYNSIEKILGLFYSSKHLRIFQIIQMNKNFNIFQISQVASLNYLEVQEILDVLINKLRLVQKIKNENEQDDFIYLVNKIDESIFDKIKINIYGIIKNIKYEIKDKSKELKGRIKQDTIMQYINKYHSLINDFAEILNAYNFLFN